MAKRSDSYIYLGLPLYQSSPAAIERSIYFAIGRSLLVVNSKIEINGSKFHKNAGAMARWRKVRTKLDSN